jgi:hypothetical protein
VNLTFAASDNAPPLVAPIRSLSQNLQVAALEEPTLKAQINTRASFIQAAHGRGRTFMQGAVLF